MFGSMCNQAKESCLYERGIAGVNCGCAVTFEGKGGHYVIRAHASQKDQNLI